nr:MFS transporter [Allokutzneria sp. NRRL B-24872]
MLFGPFAGALVGRLPNLRVMLLVNAVRAVVIGGASVAVLTGSMSVPLLVVAAVTYGVGETLYDTANSTVVPALVPLDRLERANGRLSVAETSSNEFVGPVLGAALFGLLAWSPFAAHAGALLVSVLLLSALSRQAPRKVVPEEENADQPGVLVAVRHLLRDPVQRTITAATAVIAAVDTAWFAILVVYASRVLEVPSSAYGLLLAVGGVAGGVLVDRISARLGPVPVLTGAMLACAVSQLAIGLTSSVWVTGLALAVSSAAFAVWNVQGCRSASAGRGGRRRPGRGARGSAGPLGVTGLRGVPAREAVLGEPDVGALRRVGQRVEHPDAQPQSERQEHHLRRPGQYDAEDQVQRTEHGGEHHQHAHEVPHQPRSARKVAHHPVAVARRQHAAEGVPQPEQWVGSPHAPSLCPAVAAWRDAVLALERGGEGELRAVADLGRHGAQ